MNNFFSAIKNHKIAAVLVCVALTIGIGASNSSKTINPSKQLINDNTQVISNSVIKKDDNVKVSNNVTTKKKTSTKKTTKSSKNVVNNKSKKSTKKSVNSNYTVYITRTGSKYHRSGCSYLRQSMIKTSKNSAISMGYSACKVCKP